MSEILQRTPAAALDVARLRRDFPVFAPGVWEPRLAYLDNAASAQKPQAVIDAISRFYSTSYSNVHRGIHPIAARADAAYEGARQAVARWLGAPAADEVVFVRGTTEAINLVAASYLGPRLGAADEVLVTELEHHSNLVPWQRLCAAVGARLVAAPVDDRGALRMDEFAHLLSPRTRMVAVAHVSNALGTVLPVAEIARLAHRHGAPVLVDGAQAVPHGPVDVAALGCDFYAVSAHKMFGPTGIGALWGRRELLAEMPPYQGGGGMIRAVSFAGTTYAPAPARFEAGTPHIAGAVGWAAAVEYLEGLDATVGWETLAAHETGLLAEATERLAEVPGVRIVGTAPRKQGVLSFVLDCAHPHDVGTVLAGRGVAVRAGHHCAQPLMDRLGVAATTRASFALYNDRRDVDALVDGVREVRELFG